MKNNLLDTIVAQSLDIIVNNYGNIAIEHLLSSLKNPNYTLPQHISDLLLSLNVCFFTKDEEINNEIKTIVINYLISPIPKTAV